MNTISSILSKAEDLFMKYGIKSISMDEIAGNLGISKKTLYQYVENKADLVNKIMKSYLDEDRLTIEDIRDSSDNAIDEVVNIFRYVCRRRKEFKPAILYDLKKYYPSSWLMFIEYKQNYMRNKILNNIEEGKKQGYYRSDVKAEIISKFYLAAIDASLDSELFPNDEFSFLDVYSELIRYHLFGITSKKGIEYLNKINQSSLYV